MERIRESGVGIVVRELWRTNAPLTIAYLALIAVQSLLPTAAILCTAQTVAAVPGAYRSGAGSPEARTALEWLIVLGAVGVAMTTVAQVTNVVGAAVARRASRRWDGEMMAAVAAPSTVAHLEDPDLLDRIEKATGANLWGPIQAVAALQGVTASVIGPLVKGVVLAVHWPLLALVRVGFSGLVLRPYGNTRYRSITSSVLAASGTHRRSGYLRGLAIQPDSAKEVRAFGLIGWLRDRYHGEWSQAMAPVFPAIRKGWPRSLVFGLTEMVVVVAGAWLIVGDGLDRAVGLAAVITGLNALIEIEPLSRMDDNRYVFTEGVGHLRARRPILEELARRAAEANAGRGPVAVSMPERSIRFESVDFAYPGSSASVFAGFDLTIEAGRSLAVVGVNGAGKTTLVKLLAGLQRPTAGRVLIDGTPLFDLDAAAWQRQVAAIFQDFVRYPTAAENVGFGAPEHIDDVDALQRAAVRAGADDVLLGLPQAWDTILDRTFDGGVEVSGGQWQRIALARALFAVERGARVLVLDEPTAALDVRAEADLYDRFLDITHGLTSIVISHRFSTVRRADRIVVVDGGRVIEDGSHDELVALDGRYAHLFELQASRYRDGEEVSP